VASARDDTTVTVLPTREGNAEDERMARETRTDLTGDRLLISIAGQWRQWVIPTSSGSVNVMIELPTGSAVEGKALALLAEGRLGRVGVKATAGDLRLGDVEDVALHASAGSVTVGRIGTSGTVTAAAGSVRIGEVAGEASVRSPNGPIAVGAVTGTLAIKGAHAPVSVDRVAGSLTATAAHAEIRVDRVESGIVRLTNSYGSVEVGVAEGTAAWLDIESERGTVRNLLEPSDTPAEDGPTAQVHVRTGYGDVLVRRPDSFVREA
jgi:DUF4097 and DUF4098 domain-containing protein YvlB